MIIKKIIMHNFGAYLDKNVLDLKPLSPQKPIILIGGLNGAGKTTILDALQLCFFGAHAKCSGRKNISYDAYLNQSISKNAIVPEAAIEILIEHVREGKSQELRISRSWKRTGKSCVENIEVFIDGKHDVLLSEHWAEQVDEYLPSRIAPLFFYDGEKIEGYADPHTSSEMISTAIYNLLGLDLVERLYSDLIVLERRKKVETKIDHDFSNMKHTEEKLKEIEKSRRYNHQNLASIRTKNDQLKKNLSEVDKIYRKEGGALFEQREELEGKKIKSEEKYTEVVEEIKEFVAGPAPLLLVQNYLDIILKADMAELESKKNIDAYEIIKERDNKLIESLKSWNSSKEFINKIAKHLEDDRTERESTLISPIFNLSQEARSILIELDKEVLSRTEERLISLLDSESQAQKSLDESINSILAIPNEDSLSKINIQRNMIMDEIVNNQLHLKQCEAEDERLQKEKDKLVKELEQIRQLIAEDKLLSEETSRIIRYSEKVRKTLDLFKIDVVNNHVASIESYILQSLKKLLRKEGLIDSVKIDSKTFKLDLFDENGFEVPPERLSAGERQLLSVAILWGLACVSRRSLPAVIDTPLGRLDSVHRNSLLTRYFPNASHQVILLSTDEEIFDDYFDKIQPWVSKSYELKYDERSHSTKIVEGYLSRDNHQ